MVRREARVDCIDAARAAPRLGRRPLADHLLQIAMLGGYFARSRDPVAWSSGVQPYPPKRSLTPSAFLRLPVA